MGSEPLARIALNRELVVRACLITVMVLISHIPQWHFLRFATSEAVRLLASTLGMATARASYDTILINNSAFQFVISCTFIDVFAGCLPLLWRGSDPLIRNLQRITVTALMLFPFNVFRLEVSQILYASGIGWYLADQVVGGISYFVVWVAICRVRAWSIGSLSNDFEVQGHVMSQS